MTAYLTDVLRRLSALMPTDAAAIGELLPDRWAKTHPQHVLAPASKSPAPRAKSAAGAGPLAACCPQHDGHSAEPLLALGAVLN